MNQRHGNKGPSFRIWMVFGSAFVLIIAAGCGKKTLDKNVDRLVKAAQENDYEAFKEMAHSSLLAEYTKPKLEYLSRVLKRLGAYKERTMKGIEARTGGIRRGNYKLRFEKATISLKLTLKDKKLVGFMFSGEALEQEAKALRNEAFKEFKVVSFKFYGQDNKPAGNIFKPDQPIVIKMGVTGLTRTAGGVHVRAALRLLDAKGQQVLANPNFLNKTLPVKPDEPNAATLSATLTLKIPGTYRLQLRVFDVPGNRHLDYQQAVVVEAR